MRARTLAALAASPGEHAARIMAAAVALLLAGCSPPLTIENPWTPPPLAIRADAATTAPIALVRGQTLVVTLDANVTTGFRWEAVAGFEPTLTQVGTADYVAPASPPAEPGAPGTMTFRFRAATAGTTTLEFAYRRPFELNVAPAKTVRYDVAVR